MDCKYCIRCMRSIGTDGPYCPWCRREVDTEPEDLSVLPCGTTLRNGQYLVGKVLGRGGFGITYLGMNRNLELKVAIKEYYPKTVAARNPNAPTLRWSCTAENREAGCESFVREAKQMAHMASVPNVVMVHDIIENENNTVYIVMGYIEGETLRQRLRQSGGTMSAADCVRTLSPIFAALSEIHRQGLIHRDVSPNNIMIDERGKIWLLDLGAAKESGYAPDGGAVIVKRGYSPPEQYRKNGKIGTWTDVYALCATMYFCLTAQHPPDVQTRRGGAALVFPTFVPAPLTAVLQRGMDLETQRRIQTVKELQQEIDRAMASEPDPDDCETQFLDENREPESPSFDRRADAGQNTSGETADFRGEPRQTGAPSGRRLWKTIRLPLLAVCIAAGLGAWLFLRSRGTDGPATAEDAAASGLQTAADTVSSAVTESPESAGAGPHTSHAVIVDSCSWTEAFEKARLSGGHLAWFETREEYAGILSEVEVLGLRDVAFRIGARRAQDGEDYYWVDNDDTLFGVKLNGGGSWTDAEWLEGEPSFHWNGSSEEFLEFYYDLDVDAWVWNDVADEVYDSDIRRYGYIIEYPVREAEGKTAEPSGADGASA